MEKGYLHYFDWEMYFIICLSYSFGFIGGWIKGWILPLSLLFFAYPFYLRQKIIKKKLKQKIEGKRK